MLKVHHLNNSRSQRILWLLEELKLPYEIVYYQRDSKTMLAPLALKQVHPLGKSPMISDGDRVVAETAVIVEYLVELANGELGPVGESEKQRYRYFLHYAEGSLMPPLLLLLVLARIPLFGKRAMARVQPMLDVHLDWLETELASRDWFAGDRFTAADVMMSFPIEAAKVRGGLNASRPRLMAWLDRIHSRPAYKQALAKGGQYDFV